MRTKRWPCPLRKESAAVLLHMFGNQKLLMLTHILTEILCFYLSNLKLYMTLYCSFVLV